MPGMSDNFDVTQTTQVLPLPDLPALNNRWTMRRKATLIFAVRSGRISIEEACRVYKLSVDELLAWARRFIRTEPTDTLSLLQDLNAGILGVIRYRPREEEGTQAPLETLAKASGSCRDIAALFIDAARHLGFGAPRR